MSLVITNTYLAFNTFFTSHKKPQICVNNSKIKMENQHGDQIILFIPNFYKAQMGELF